MGIKSDTIIDKLKILTLIETSKLVRRVEKTFGVSSLMSQVITNLIKEPSLKEDVAEEKDAFDVVLTEAPAEKKISILKIVRNITGLGLKESKEIVDNLPKTLKEGLTKVECESIQKELETAGAKVVIK